MKNNELVLSLVFGAMATFVVVLVWGRRLVRPPSDLGLRRLKSHGMASTPAIP